MSSFSEGNFAKKLVDLNQSQQSIQTLSLWLIHHRKHSKTITQVWMKELKKAKPNRKLTFVYLANDVVQNSKKKGPEFSRDFLTVLPDAYKCCSRECDEKTKGSLGRMLNIWKERNVFEAEFIETLKLQLNNKAKHISRKKERASAKAAKVPASKPPSEQPPPAKKKKKEQSLLEEIEIEMEKMEREQAPIADELIKALEDLENSASSDAAVRERIAALPPEVSDINMLDKLKDKKEAQELSGMVDEACVLLADYNGRLTSELDERKRVAVMLRYFIASQKEALVESEKSLQDYKSKLEKVASLRKELKSHIQSLPDLTLLPDMTGLAPLPSAGDLFSTGENA